MKRTGFLSAMLLLAVIACAAPTRVIVAAGTTLVDSGVLDELASRYETEHPDVELSVVGESTARGLELGRRGGADRGRRPSSRPSTPSVCGSNACEKTCT